MKRVPNLPMKEFKRLLKIAPVLAVDVIIVKGGSFLLEKRTYPPYTGRWHVPGGIVGYAERLTTAAKRKALQETGLKVGGLKYVGYYDDPKLDPRGRIVVHTFTARPIGGKLKKDGLVWFKKVPSNIIPFNRNELKDAKLV